MQPIDPAGSEDEPRRAAPGRLELVRQFINTADLYPGEEQLSDLDSLRSWLREHGLIGARERLAAGDLERALAVREGLRALLEARERDGGVDAATVRALNDHAPEALLRVNFNDRGVPALEAVGGGLGRAFAELFAIIQLAEVDGSWDRLKVCADHQCLWAFYDQSKNHSRSWCNMAVCGNRAKARQYRRRHRAPAGARRGAKS
ncbi:MAG: CGNR zinc finger domain-containing protein [Solirubrobacteraceae bacterium]|jgi:predicted RNA-binding Zn ribbon-like protein